jgi:ATPase subunit of ABC transporter with duplicated ATPase domains
MLMPASITTSHLGWSTPDGRAVLSGLDLSFAQERTGITGRNGTGKTTLLRLLSGALTPSTGKVLVNGTIATLRQMVQVDRQETVADLFGAAAGLTLLKKAEAGEADMDDLTQADWTLEARILSALGKVGLDADADTRLAALSGGQRTRAALAGVIFKEPDFLLLDEPTNNLDRDGRQAVLSIVTDWRAGAIVVSHDRELLEAMDAIVELTSLGATRYGGNWSDYQARKAIELAAVQQDLDEAERQVAAINRKTQQAVERKQRRDSTGKAKGARGDMPRILIGKRKERAENSGGDAVRLADRLRTEAASVAKAARERIEILEPLAVTIAPTRLPAGKTVLRLDQVSGGYDPHNPVIRDLSLTITGPERIALTGANGAGKTTLLMMIAGRLPPVSGRIERGTAFAMLDQTAGMLNPSLSIAENFRAMNPGAGENSCRAALARFQFRADAALRIVSTLSGGQMLRAGLACLLGGAEPPPLLILDEPTNHLDLDSIAAVEAGLGAYDGALLVVSHDETFLKAIGISRRIALSP